MIGTTQLGLGAFVEVVSFFSKKGKSTFGILIKSPAFNNLNMRRNLLAFATIAVVSYRACVFMYILVVCSVVLG